MIFNLIINGCEIYNSEGVWVYSNNMSISFFNNVSFVVVILENGRYSTLSLDLKRYFNGVYISFSSTRKILYINK